MDSKRETKESTVQGRDTPVPVRGLSGRAGSPGPSASDRSALPVATQAGSGYTTTGTKGSKGKSQGANLNQTVFRFRERVNSLPENPREGERIWALGGMKRKGRGSLSEGEAQEINTSYTSLVWDEEAQRSVKKSKDSEWTDRGRRLNLSGTGRLRDKVSTLVQQVDAELRNMRKVVKENKNTKVELKEGVERLSSMVSQLATKEVYDALEGLEGERQVIVMDDSEERLGTQESPDREELARRLAKAEEEIRKLRDKNDFLTREMEKLKGHKEQVTDQIITEADLTDANTYGKFKRIEHRPWSEKIYKAAFMAVGTPLNGNREADMVFIGDEQDCSPEKEALQQDFINRYPELSELEGRVDTLSNIIRTKSRDGTTTERERLIYRVEAGENDEEWFNLLADLKTKVIEARRRKLAFYPPERDKRGLGTRKMLECLFRCTGVKCLVYNREPLHKQVGKRGPLNKLNTEAILVKKEGCRYSDLLRTVKERVRPDSEAARVIKTIRESREGNMVIVVDSKNKEASKTLASEIAKVQGITARHVGRPSSSELVYVKGIDAITTREEVVGAMSEVEELQGVPFEVSELRPMFGRNQTATIRLEETKARSLVARGKIRIGLNWCSIEKRVDVIQCFKCWGFGHVRARCRENIDLVDACRKCGRGGHKSRDCIEDERCLNCKVSGHRAGSGKCPLFRKALARAKTREKKKRAY